MKTLDELVAGSTDHELKEAFGEIIEWRETGVLKMDGLIRKTHAEFCETNNGISLPMHVMEAPFLFEIAKRHYSVEKK